jgi:hypothetical protein
MGFLIHPVSQSVSQSFIPSASLSCMIKLLRITILSIWKIILFKIILCVSPLLLIPVTARSKTWVCGRSLAGIVGSNPARGMEVCLLWVLCVVNYGYLRRTDLSSRGVLPTVVRSLCVIYKSPEWGGHNPRWAAAPREKTKYISTLYSDQGRDNDIPYSCTLRSGLTLLHVAAVTELQIVFLTVVVKQTIWIFLNGL